jgi:hypothetical protein
MPRKLVTDCTGRCRRRSWEYGYNEQHSSRFRKCVQPVGNGRGGLEDCGGQLVVRSVANDGKPWPFRRPKTNRWFGNIASQEKPWDDGIPPWKPPEEDGA